MSPQDPIQRRKLYQEVLDRLKARIVAGEFGPNDQLPSERELMESYSVGRPAVREALQHLEHAGLWPSPTANEPGSWFRHRRHWSHISPAVPGFC